MAQKKWSKKDERQYEKIKESLQKRGRGRAEEIAARTVQKQRREEGRTKKQQQQRRARGERKAEAGLEERTRQELYEEAKRLDIQGRSKMKKRELIRAIQKRR